MISVGLEGVGCEICINAIQNVPLPAPLFLMDIRLLIQEIIRDAW